jgi:hypothetical protein
MIKATINRRRGDPDRNLEVARRGGVDRTLERARGGAVLAGVRLAGVRFAGVVLADPDLVGAAAGAAVCVAGRCRVVSRGPAAVRAR